jgi:hypothetical protein
MTMLPTRIKKLKQHRLRAKKTNSKNTSTAPAARRYIAFLIIKVAKIAIIMYDGFRKGNQMTAIPSLTPIATETILLGSCPCEGRDPVRRSRIYKGVRVAKRAGPLPCMHRMQEHGQGHGSEPTRRRGAPLGNRNALKSGRYTAKAKAERKRTRLLLRQLRAGLAYMRSVIRARAAAAKISKIEKQFAKARTHKSVMPALRGHPEAGHAPHAFAWPSYDSDSHDAQTRSGPPRKAGVTMPFFFERKKFKNRKTIPAGTGSGPRAARAGRREVMKISVPFPAKSAILRS